MNPTAPSDAPSGSEGRHALRNLLPCMPMRAYLWTTGLIFALIVVAHVWRVVAESRDLAGDPFFLLLTLLAALLLVWAGILLRRTAPTKRPLP